MLNEQGVRLKAYTLLIERVLYFLTSHSNGLHIVSNVHSWYVNVIKVNNNLLDPYSRTSYDNLCRVFLIGRDLKVLFS